MNNVIPLKITGGFTRMENKLIEALMVVDLPGRELKVALYVARATIGFHVPEARIQATEISKATNIHPDVASKAISHLLKRRVLYRVGGARGDIGISDPSEWIFYDIKNECPNQTISSDSDHSARVVSIARQTKSDDSLLYTKKEPLLTLSSKEINPPQEQPKPAKPDRKAAFGMAQLLADNPHNVPEQLLADWLTQRKAKRAAVTATVWSTVNTELAKCAEAGITAADAITEALNSGWQGFKASWVIKRLAESAPAPVAQSRHTGFDERDYTAGLIQREDGSYAI
ncbi:replication protein [Pseudomonas weihenstephanensis]|uniref:Replication protein n=1 Tax=Pseudomonas weihenstephanensis TaxID=1608994 RepID=A0ABS1ZJU0_9PSED|nr:replication protein [Pseudomonas weihenstephanensis]MBM1196740.1 replication protein [Pseudomonas weihenstephanensis]